MPTDRYQQLTNSMPGRFISKRLGLPQPIPLRRYEPGQPLLNGPALVGAAPGGRLLKAVAKVLKATKSEAYVTPQSEAKAAATAAKLGPTVWSADAAENDELSFGALIFDASGIGSTGDLTELYDFFHPTVRKLGASGRVVILATPPEMSETPRQAIAQRAIEGFVRSLGKEIGGKGAIINLVYVAPGAEESLESTLRFFLSSKSAFVDAQVVRVGAAKGKAPRNWEQPLKGKVALVTGASRGIGASIAETLARDGAHVVCLDIPKQGDELAEVANKLGGETLQADITDAKAPQQIVDHLKERHGGVDVFVHNAGITQDKTLGRMSEDQWGAVLAVNLTSQERINDALIEGGALKPGGRIVTVSSMSGIAGNRGQVNYATTKAGVIGTVDALAPVLAKQDATINAVAPGFIETKMTSAMPIGTREAGRRLSSLAQGGLPVDVAETIAWFANPASSGVNGNTVRVCGQNLLGA
jgi:3-oxoacyl-[acyl-carrier protein] reductase